jgi:hypothetical protein
MSDKSQESNLDAGASSFDLFLGLAGIIGPVGALNSVRKAIQEKRTERAMRNITLFLKEVDQTTEEQKEKLKVRLGKDYQKFIDSLLLALDQLEDEEKAAILGKLFLALLEDKLQPNEFRKFAKVIELVYISTLTFLLKQDSGGFIIDPRGRNDVQYFNELIGLGLMESEYEVKTEQNRNSISRDQKTSVIQKFKFNTLGNLFLDILIYRVREAGYKERTERDKKNRRDRTSKKNVRFL